MRRPTGTATPEQNSSNSVNSVNSSSKERKSKPWLFLLCAWACYMYYIKYVWVDTSKHIRDTPVDVSFIEVEPFIPEETPKTALIVEKPGLILSVEEREQEHDIKTIIDESKEEQQEETSKEQVDDDRKGNEGLPMIGATLALSGKCATPDYGTKIFYIKTKHTGSGKLAGILRRIGFIHNMEVADPPKGGNAFRDETDFHRVAQGRCVDMLVAHTKRAPWIDKAFKGSLKFTSVSLRTPFNFEKTSPPLNTYCTYILFFLFQCLHQVRDPIIRAVSAYEHSLACGQHCSMCWKLIEDKVRWARQCADVADAQYNLMKGG